MTSFIRWEWLVPRLLAIVVLLLAAQYGFSVLMRSAIIHAGQAAIGAKVELAHARVSPAGGLVELHDLRITNPRRPMENLVEAERCALDLEVGALLHKQIIIDRGQVTGLVFGAPRKSSGAIRTAEPSMSPLVTKWLGDQSVEIAEAWLKKLEQQFARDLVSELESVRLTQELIARWPEQYRELKHRARQLGERSDQLQASIRTAQENPLRHADFLKRLPKEIGSLRNDFAALATEIDRLPDIIDADRRAIIAARKHDEVLIREALRIEAIDAGALTAYFLREQWNGPVGQLLSWLSWAGELLAGQPEIPQAPGHRGVDVLFAGRRRAPDLMIRTLDLQGTGHFNGQAIELHGSLNGLTSAPALHDEPIRLSLASLGPVPLRLQATFDRSDGAIRDELLVDCPKLPLPIAMLGNADKLGLAISPSTAAVSVSLLAEGEQITGNIQFVQQHVALEPRFAGRLKDVPLAAALEDTLGRIDSIASRVSIEGSLDAPNCRLWSNLGPAVAESMDRALRRAADEHAAQLLAASQQRIDEHFASLERQLAEQQAALMKSLDGPTTTLKRIAAEQRLPDRLPSELGRRLPSGSLFR